MKYEYVLFDLDGTLSESALGITRCVQYALRCIGIHEPDLQKLASFVGPPLNIQFMNSYGVDEKKAAYLVEKYRERYIEKGIYECRMYQGVEDMLAHCFQMGIRLAVASSKPEVFVKQIIHDAGLDPYFSVVAGSGLQDEFNGTATDNKAVVISRALNRLTQGQHQKTAMVGDRIFDMQGAKTNQVTGIGVTYGYGTKEELAQADVIVDDIWELEKELTR